MKNANVLPISVYRSGFGDFTNGGISSRYDTLLCLCERGFLEVDMDNPPDNLVKIVKRIIGGVTVYHAEPVANPSGVGWMAGGNYAASCDSRFSEMIGGTYGAISIHDRQETQEEYDLLSR